MKITDLTLGDWMELAGMAVAMLASLPLAVGLLTGSGTVILGSLAVIALGCIPMVRDRD